MWTGARDKTDVMQRAEDLLKLEPAEWRITCDVIAGIWYDDCTHILRNHAGDKLAKNKCRVWMDYRQMRTFWRWHFLFVDGIRDVLSTQILCFQLGSWSEITKLILSWKILLTFHCVLTSPVLNELHSPLHTHKKKYKIKRRNVWLHLQPFARP